MAESTEIVCPHCGKTFVMAKPKKLHEVKFMEISSQAAKLIHKYINLVERYDNGYETSGYTPREFELVRTKAHNAVLEQLKADGVDVGADRAKTTDWCKLFERWMRDEGEDA